jgi:hypothetical protein
MAYWDCPKCAAENPLFATSCWRCGFQNYGGAREDAPAATEPRAGDSADSIAKQRQDLKEEMKKSVEEGLKRGRATLDRLARGRAGGPAEGHGESTKNGERRNSTESQRRTENGGRRDGLVVLRLFLRSTFSVVRCPCSAVSPFFVLRFPLSLSVLHCP